MMFYVIVNDVDVAQKIIAELNADDIKTAVDRKDYGVMVGIDPKDVRSLGIDGLDPKQRREFFQSDWLERTSLSPAPIVVQIDGRKKYHEFIVNRFFWHRI